jgi:hypothetical protein
MWQIANSVLAFFTTFEVANIYFRNISRTLKLLHFAHLIIVTCFLARDYLFHTQVYQNVLYFTVGYVIFSFLIYFGETELYVRNRLPLSLYQICELGVLVYLVGEYRRCSALFLLFLVVKEVCQSWKLEKLTDKVRYELSATPIIRDERVTPSHLLEKYLKTFGLWIFWKLKKYKRCHLL